MRRLFALFLIAALIYPMVTADGEQPAEKGEKTILLWVRIGPKESKKILEENLGALKKAKGIQCSWSSIEFEEVPREVFEFLEKQLKRETPKSNPPPTGPDTVKFRKLAAGEWEVSLPKKEKGAFTLEKLVITYQGDKKPQTLARNAEESNNRPKWIRRGVYEVKLEHEDPDSYEATVTDSGTPIAEPFKGKFPQGDQYFAIAIKQFRGDQKELLELLQKTGDDAPLSTPFIGVKPTENYSLAFANWKTENSASAATMVENKYIPNVAAIANKPTRKVWILFPLSKAEAMKKQVDFAKFGPVSMMKEIGKGSNKKVLASDPNVVVDGDVEPRWFELVRDPQLNTFSRGIAMKDFPKLQDKYKDGFWHVKVYEYDVEGETQAIPLADKKMQTLYFIAEEVKELPAEIDRRAKNEAKPTEKPKE